MKIDEDFHQKAIVVCIDELASRPSAIMVSVHALRTLTIKYAGLVEKRDKTEVKT